MPLFIVDIQKKLAGFYWTNTYIVEAADIAGARDQARDIVEAERIFHSARITFDKFRVSTITKGDDAYISVPLDQTGRFMADQVPLPPFCTVNVLFETGANRPGRKYYRTLARNGDITADFKWTQNYINVVTQALGNLLGGGSVILLDRGGDPIQTFVVQDAIGMHQMRRGSKRRARPVIP